MIRRLVIDSSTRQSATSVERAVFYLQCRSNNNCRTSGCNFVSYIKILNDEVRFANIGLLILIILFFCVFVNKLYFCLRVYLFSILIYQMYGILYIVSVYLYG